MNVPDSFYRVSVKALILDESKRFMLFEEENGWELPGGGLDFGENPRDGLIRELREESGLEITSVENRPSYFITALHMNGYWKTNVVYRATVKDLQFTSSKECLSIRFFTKEEAAAVEAFPIMEAFLKEFNPENHLSS